MNCLTFLLYKYIITCNTSCILLLSSIFSIYYIGHNDLNHNDHNHNHNDHNDHNDCRGKVNKLILRHNIHKEKLLFLFNMPKYMRYKIFVLPFLLYFQHSGVT